MGCKDSMDEQGSNEGAERKILEDRLKKSENEKTLILNSLSEVLIYLDAGYKILWANKAAAGLSGVTAGELEGRHCYEVWNRRSEPCEECPVKKSLQSGGYEEGERVSSDGKVLRVRSYPVCSENGIIAGALVIVADITMHRLIGEQLKRSEEHYRMLAELSRDMIFVIDADDRVQYVNSFAAEYIGLAPEEIIGRQRKELFPPEVHARQADNLKKVFETGIPIFVENKLPFFDYDMWINTGLMPIRDESGRVTAVMGVSRNVTERKMLEEELQKVNESLEIRVKERTAELLKMNEDLQLMVRIYRNTEESLRESEERYRSIFDNTAISIWDKDFSGIKKYIDMMKSSGINNFREYFKKHPEIVTHCAALLKLNDVNQSTVKMYDAPDKKYFLANVGEVFCEETYDIFREELIAVSENNLDLETEGITRKFNGGKNSIAIKWAVPEGYRETLSSVLVCVTDITERKLKEEETNAMQLKLIHTNKMTSLGTLVSGVVHEINNPNSFIMSNAQLLSGIWKDAVNILEKQYTESGDFTLGGLQFSELRGLVPKLIGGVQEGSVRIKNIVDNLKNFTKPEKADLNGMIDISSVLYTSRFILHNQIKNYTDNFTVSCEDNIPFARGSSRQIEQVVINLIMNALQALPDKMCGVRVSAFFDKKLNYVTIRVKDEGIGIPEDIFGRITEPFFTTKIDAGGTGLGLSISYSIVKEHSGLMEFESEPGRGTTAYIKLPVYDDTSGGGQHEFPAGSSGR